MCVILETEGKHIYIVIRKGFILLVHIAIYSDEKHYYISLRVGSKKVSSGGFFVFVFGQTDFNTIDLELNLSRIGII